MRDDVALRTGKRTVWVVLLLATVVALTLVVLTGISADKASAATRVVTKSFSNNNQIKIPAGANVSDIFGNPSSCTLGNTRGSAAPYPSKISASFPTGSKVSDVNVVLKNYSHTFPDDVDVLLVHAGKNRTILSDAGGNNAVDSINLKLDDEARDGPPAGPSTTSGDNQIVEGTFRPFNYEGRDTFPPGAPSSINAREALSAFDGLGAKGGWSLFVADDASGDCGRFAGGWTVQIKAAVPQ